MPIINKAVKRLRKLRKRYIVDVPPDKEKAFLDFLGRAGIKILETGIEAAVAGTVKGAKS